MGLQYTRLYIYIYWLQKAIENKGSPYFVNHHVSFSHDYLIYFVGMKYYPAHMELQPQRLDPTSIIECHVQVLTEQLICVPTKQPTLLSPVLTNPVEFLYFSTQSLKAPHFLPHKAPLKTNHKNGSPGYLRDPPGVLSKCRAGNGRTTSTLISIVAGARCRSAGQIRCGIPGQ